MMMSSHGSLPGFVGFTPNSVTPRVAASSRRVARLDDDGVTGESPAACEVERLWFALFDAAGCGEILDEPA